MVDQTIVIVAVVALSASLCIIFAPDNNEFLHSGKRSLLSAKHDPATTVSKINDKAAYLATLDIGAFGTSRTWGSGLEDPNREAYVKLMSPSRGVNLGIRAADEHYPSLCLYSMVGDDQFFDAIVLEFQSNEDPPAAAYFTRLTQRLRARFPNAVIVFVVVDIPFKVYFQQRDGATREKIHLSEYLERHNYKSLSDGNFRINLRTETNATDWGLFSPEHRVAERAQAMQAIDGHVLRFPPRDNKYGDVSQDPREFLIRSAGLFGPKSKPYDLVHFSEAGHLAMANMIGDLLYTLRGVAQQQQQRPMLGDGTHIVGDWVGGKDYCQSWYESGDASMIQISGAEMVMFPHKKYALEFPEVDSSIIPHFTFNNPSHHSQEFHLTYMSMGPREDHYPVTSVFLLNSDLKKSDPVEVHPHFEGPFHINAVSYIGTAKPGENTIHLKVSTSIPTEHNFRVTGLILAPHYPSKNITAVTTALRTPGEIKFY